jgi:hypothetical protein
LTWSATTAATIRGKFFFTLQTLEHIVAVFQRLKSAALSRQILAKTGELETGKCSFRLH